jgi:hypothetical protein
VSNIRTVRAEGGRFARALVPSSFGEYGPALAEAGYVREKRRGRPSDLTDILRFCAQQGKPVYILAYGYWVASAKASLANAVHRWHGRVEMQQISTDPNTEGMALYRIAVVG